MAVTWGKVTAVTLEKNRDSDGITRMVQVDVTGPDDIQTVEYVTSAGEDSSPPIDSMVVIIDITPSFRLAIAADDLFAPESLPGAKEFFSSLAGSKLARLIMGLEGNIELTPSSGVPDGTVQLAGNARNASGVGDTTSVDTITDSVFVTWIGLVSAALNAITPGTIAVIPTTITGEIKTGADKVKLP